MSAAARQPHGRPGFRAFRGCTVPSMDMDALLPGKLAALLAGVSIRVIVNWRNRGYLPSETGPDGRRLYRARAVLAAEAATAQRCESMAGRPAERSPAGIDPGTDPRLLRRPAPPVAA